MVSWLGMNMRLITIQKIVRLPGKIFLASVYPASVPSSTLERVTVPVTIRELDIQVRISEPLNRRAKLIHDTGDGTRLGGKARTTDEVWNAVVTIQ